MIETVYLFILCIRFQNIGGKISEKGLNIDSLCIIFVPVDSVGIEKFL